MDLVGAWLLVGALYACALLEVVVVVVVPVPVASAAVAVMLWAMVNRGVVDNSSSGSWVINDGGKVDMLSGWGDG